MSTTSCYQIPEMLETFCRMQCFLNEALNILQIPKVDKNVFQVLLNELRVVSIYAYHLIFTDKSFELNTITVVTFQL